MIKDFTYFLAGACGGLLGGMGMGGGTVLIPILTFFFEIDQKTAQSINLLSFIPMAVIALFMHVKNDLIDLKGKTFLVIMSVLLSIVGSFLVKIVKGNIQTKLFGGFLIFLAILKVVLAIIDSKTKKNEKNSS